MMLSTRFLPIKRRRSSDINPRYTSKSSLSKAHRFQVPNSGESDELARSLTILSASLIWTQPSLQTSKKIKNILSKKRGHLVFMAESRVILRSLSSQRDPVSFCGRCPLSGFNLKRGQKATQIAMLKQAWLTWLVLTKTRPQDSTPRVDPELYDAD